MFEDNPVLEELLEKAYAWADGEGIFLYKKPRLAIVNRPTFPKDSYSYVTVPLAVSLKSASGSKLSAMAFTTWWLDSYHQINPLWDDSLLTPSIPSSILAKDPGKFQCNMCGFNYVLILGEKGKSYYILTIDYNDPPAHFDDISYLTHPYLVSEETAGYPPTYNNPTVTVLQNGVFGWNYLISQEPAFLLKTEVTRLPEFPFETTLLTDLSVRRKPFVDNVTNPPIAVVGRRKKVRFSEVAFEGHTVWGREDSKGGWMALRHSYRQNQDWVEEYVDGFLIGKFADWDHGPVRPPNGILDKPIPSPVPVNYTNQQFINDVFRTFPGFGWMILVELDMEYVIEDRQSPYTGPTSWIVGDFSIQFNKEIK